jgi:S1-C subfamily serine protease
MEHYDHPYYDRRPARRGPGAYLTLFAVFFALAGLIIYWFAPFGRHRALHDPDAQPRAVAPGSDPTGDEKATIDLFKFCKNSVVNVDTLQVERDRMSLNLQQRRAGTGSGFIWDDRGYVVTNYHVVREVAQNPNAGLSLRVILADRSAWNARIVDFAPDFDLAMLRIDAPRDRLTPIKVGTSKDLQVGQTVYAIGNPFGLNLTLTKGIISALDREIQSVTDQPISGVIQTDAAINPGNSGGPLLDRDGRLIGVTTAIASPSGANAGIGFAIPVDTVNDVVTELIRGGHESQPQKPTLNIVPLGDQLARELGVVSGVMIQDVQPGGAAAKAGLRGLSRTRSGSLVLGDVVVAVDGQPVASNGDLTTLIGRHKVGDTVKLTILRDGRRSPVDVTLEGI